MRLLYSVWQRYNFESNLQQVFHNYELKGAVFSMTKIQFWKQFTTLADAVFDVVLLYSVWQRYNFESNLQQIINCYGKRRCCIQYDKDTILKAIYNLRREGCSASVLYSVWQRYNFESNLQPATAHAPSGQAVFSMTKIQFWKQFTTINLVYRRYHGCIQYDKDTILKAIYNGDFKWVPYIPAVFSMTKIQFWKQFTT